MERKYRRVDKLVHDHGALTDDGKLVHGLLLADTFIENNKNPDCSFSMSGRLGMRYEAQREAAIKELEIPKAKKRQVEIIVDLKQRLIDQGHPHWVAVDGRVK